MRIRTSFIVVAILVWALPVRAEIRPPDYLPRYDLNINLNVEGHRAHVVQNITWVNRSNRPIEELVFNVHSRYTPPKRPLDRLAIAKMLEIMRVAEREAMWESPAFQLTKVTQRATDGSGATKELAHRFRNDLETALVVSLPYPVPPGGSAAVSLEYTMELPQKQGRWGQWRDVTALSNWHPVLAYHDSEKGWQPTPFVPWHQSFFNEAGVFNVRVRLPKDQNVACTGTVTKVVEDGATKEIFVGPVVARDWALLVSARFREYEAFTAGPTKVRVRCLAFPEHEHYAKALAKHAARAIEVYSKWFGAYPYPELSIVESYFGWNGNECGGLVMIDERVFAMPHFAEGYGEYLISHEVCHQWFYNTIGTDGFRETFMDEAFATYFAHRLLNQAEGKNNSLLKFPKGLGWLPGINREDYRYSSFYYTLRNGELSPPLQEMTKYRHVGNLFSATYDRGGKIVGMIEERLGETAFLEFMRRIYARYYFKVIKADDFRAELEEYTGQPWGEFFKKWLNDSGMSDWAVEAVTVHTSEESKTEPADELTKGKYTATVIIKQKAQHDEPTEVGFSFNGGDTYDIRVPVMPEAGKMTFKELRARVEPLDNHRVKITAELPAEPNQVTVDPDQILPDSEPANNHWKARVRWRLTPFYTMLEETGFTTAYDRWNVTAGPWFYGPTYADPWFTRSTVVGARVGGYRTEEFSGGAYLGYRPSYRDLAVGIDGVFRHWPLGKMEVGYHAEKSIAQITKSGADLDRAAVFSRYVFDQTPSMYLAPMHHVETFAAWQRNFLPEPRTTLANSIEFKQMTMVGAHYHVDLLTPYWDPETGFKFDVTAAMGLPIFGQDQRSYQGSAQLSVVRAPPDGFGWLSQTRVAMRLLGAWGWPTEGRLFALGGDMQFRGFDMAERQGSRMWVGSLEWRVPIIRRLDLDAVDHFFRLKNVYLAPFYDVGDIYLNGQSLGPMAHAVGLGVRLDVAWFSFLERTMLRLDVAKTVNVNSPVQFWIGVQHPF